jgi:hypothetical protein
MAEIAKKLGRADPLSEAEIQKQKDRQKARTEAMTAPGGPESIRGTIERLQTAALKVDYAKQTKEGVDKVVDILKEIRDQKQNPDFPQVFVGPA